jgi:hypothetical protein
MTQYGLPFDGILIGDATKAPYSAAEWARQYLLRHGVGTAFPNYGVFRGSGNGSREPLEVLATNPVSAAIEVQPGAALVNGRFYESTAAEQLAIAANAAGNPRIDTIVLRLDFVSQTVRLAVLQGAAAASPVRQTLTQNASFWEIPLADVAVANGFTTLAQSTITPRQRDVITASHGWLPYAYGLNVNPAGSYITAANVVANGGSVAVPVVLGANLLLEDVGVISLTASTAFEYGWDLYFEDTNDGLTAENTLRRVAQSNGNATGTFPGSSAWTNLAVLGGAVPLAPGLYWLVWQNRHATNAVDLGAQLIGGPFSVGSNQFKRKTTTNPNGATLDFVTSWNNLTNVIALRLRGRVFGQATAF